MAERDLITIRNDRSQCVLCPELGGSVIRWAVDGQPILRVPESDAIASGDPLTLASFPLVPYSNRIGNARFDWDGQTVHLTPNFPPEPHAIHGIGWTMPWQVEAIEKHRCILTIEHAGDARWPFAFAASQSFELLDGALEITSTAINRSYQPAPLAFGHHPYFDQQGAWLRFNAESMLMNGKDALPLGATVPMMQFDFASGGTVTGRDIDHCYANWDGLAEIRWENKPLALRINADMAAAVLYIPAAGSAFCFEPVPHVNNAVNRPDLSPAIPVIQPGEQFVSNIVMQTVSDQGRALAWSDLL
jgi:aldose 1-epimerase